MQVQGPFGPPGQMISWVPMFRPPGKAFGYHVEPYPPGTYFSNTVCPMSCLPQAQYKRVPVRVLFPHCTCPGGMTSASPAPQRVVQQVEEQPEERAEETLDEQLVEQLVEQLGGPLNKELEEQLEEQAEDEDIDVVSCPPDSTAVNEPLSDPLEDRIRQLLRLIGDRLPGGRLPGSTSRGKAFSRAYQKEFRDEINRSGSVTNARRLAKHAGGAASDKEKERLEREAPPGSLARLLDELSSACSRAVHRQYQIARRAEFKRSGDPEKAREAARLACRATRLRLEQIGGINNSHKSIHFTNADILNAYYLRAYRRAKGREFSRSGDLVKAKQAGRVAGYKARAQTEQELLCDSVAVRKAFKVTPSMAAGKEYRAAFRQAKGQAYKMEMARSGDPVRAGIVAYDAGKKAGSEARKAFMLACRLRSEGDKNGASGSELRENITE